MKKAKSLALFLVMAALLVFAAACGNSGDKKEEGTDGGKAGGDTKTEEVSGTATASGSTALQPLAQAAAEEFMNENSKAEIQIQGGGSGTGLSQVADGAVNMGNSDVFAEEKDGIPADKLTDHKVAVVAMTAAVNPKAGITDISKEDLKKVFTGKVKNWKEVGGKDLKITLVNRPESSGTRATFDKFALDGEKPAEGITEDSSNTVKKIISQTDGAIGYLATSYFTDDKVTQLSIDGVKADEENVTSGKFPVWAYEHVYTKGEATGVTKSFLDYMMSEKVQNEIVPQQGYFAVTKMKVERDAEGKVTNK
ncbi:phosphate ABC transporter substrate-binding protein [Metabacillus sp. GX 13764]|uniref:phosphate ABC transporter substrate-binding protein n=1 Tax=Metabacillus kandeliae TaxID=2900151 RepID=UPI001E31CE1B|nr:phosphate ABC transporter substrate-binding protein [Metabacillus kandeliae]MCD7033094.1 phosphate ABC transporter substrate-binding protein [Metabacillus kandeliae]